MRHEDADSSPSRGKVQRVGLAVTVAQIRVGWRLLRALRRQRPQLKLRFPPAFGRALLQVQFDRSFPESVGPGATDEEPGEWLDGCAALLVPEWREKLRPVVEAARARGLPILTPKSPGAESLLGAVAAYFPLRPSAAAYLAALDELAFLPPGASAGSGAAISATPQPGSRPVEPKSERGTRPPECTSVRASTRATADTKGGPRTDAVSLSVILAPGGTGPHANRCRDQLAAAVQALPAHWNVELLVPDPEVEYAFRELGTAAAVDPSGMPDDATPGRVWNGGAQGAAGQVLCFAWSDTWFASDGLRRLTEAALSHGIAAPLGASLTPALTFRRTECAPPDMDYPLGGTLAVRWDVLEAVGSFNEATGGDTAWIDWGLRARESGHAFSVAPGAAVQLGRSAELASAAMRSGLDDEDWLEERWSGCGIGERIVVRRTGAIGDVLMALPAVQALREHLRLARIYLQCADAIADLVRDLPFLDGAGPAVPPGCTHHFDLDDAYERYERSGEWRHPVFAFAAALGVPVQPGAYPVPVCGELAGWAAELLPNTGSYPLIACGLRSAGRPKANWGERRWYELAAARPDWRFVLLDGKARAPLEVAGSYDGPSPYDLPNVVDLTGRTATLRHLVALLRRCTACVSIDTGLFHLAAAVGLPMVGLFGGAPAWSRLPLAGQGVMLPGEAPCYPCRNPARCSRIDGPHCLAVHTPEAVAESLDCLLLHVRN